MMIKGQRVVDAHKPIVLYVHEKDVAKGQVKNCEECAIAIALKRQLKVARVRVYLTRTYVFTGGRWVRYHTPKDAREQLRKFDQGRGFEEAVYKLVPPYPTERLNSRGHGSSEKSLALLNNKHAKGKHKTGKGVRQSAYLDLRHDLLQQKEQPTGSE